MDLEVGDMVDTEVHGRPVEGEIVAVGHQTYTVDTRNGELRLPAEEF